MILHEERLREIGGAVEGGRINGIIQLRKELNSEGIGYINDGDSVVVAGLQNGIAITFYMESGTLCGIVSGESGNIAKVYGFDSFSVSGRRLNVDTIGASLHFIVA